LYGRSLTFYLLCRSEHPGLQTKTKKIAIFWNVEAFPFKHFIETPPATPTKPGNQMPDQEADEEEKGGETGEVEAEEESEEGDKEEGEGEREN
jgi:hypothetical protein